MDSAAEKKRLRPLAAARRDALDPQARARAAARFAAYGLEFLELPAPAVVSGYCAFGSEADCVPLFERLTGEGHTTCLPVIEARFAPLVFRCWAPGEPLVPGRHGIAVPATDAAAVEPDVLLVPLLAFDRSGVRLGYGGGYYDRTIEGLRKRRATVAVGLAYGAQEMDAVPAEPFDQRLDWVLSEDGPIRIGVGG